METRTEEGPSVKDDRVTVQENPQPSEKAMEGGENKQSEKPLQQQPSSIPKYKPTIPYPARLKQYKEDAQFKKFLNIFKQLHVNIPLVEALSQMPKYAKFMKDLFVNKRKLEELEIMALSGNCSVVIQKVLPRKSTDPRSFSIPCVIRGRNARKSLSRFSSQH